MWLSRAVLRFLVLKMSIFFFKGMGGEGEEGIKGIFGYSGCLSIRGGSGGETGLPVGASLSTAKMAASFSTRSLFLKTQFTCAPMK